jgi:phosphoglycolate phosphatase-like HAD superfamily hydrolase
MTLRHIFLDFEGVVVVDGVLVKGMDDVIKELARVCTLSIISSSGSDYIRARLAEAGVAHHIAHVLGYEVGADKTKKIQSILDVENYDPADCLFVTDTVKDVRSAAGARVLSVGTSWGMDSADQLLLAGALSVALTPRELPSALLPSAVAKNR